MRFLKGWGWFGALALLVVAGMDPSDGCETDARRSDLHCGRCGNACTGGETCRNSACR